MLACECCQGRQPKHRAVDAPGSVTFGSYPVKQGDARTIIPLAAERKRGCCCAAAHTFGRAVNRPLLAVPPAPLRPPRPLAGKSRHINGARAHVRGSGVDASKSGRLMWPLRSILKAEQWRRPK